MTADDSTDEVSAPDTTGGDARSEGAPPPRQEPAETDGPVPHPGADAGPLLLEPADPALRRGRRPATSLLTLGTVAVVLAIVIVLVVIKVTGNSTVSTNSGPVQPSPAPASVVQAVTHIPSAVYDAVGVTSGVATVTAPALLHGQPPLQADGKPEVVFVGNEFCPYCAAERWALVAALSRFGRFTTLNAMQSGSNEAFSSTPTFTFHGSRYTSPYLSVRFVERYGTDKNAAGTAYAALEPLTAKVRSLLDRYDRSTAAATGALLPFIDIGNQAVVTGGSFSPSILEQLNESQIASGLTDAKDPATQAIVATANYLTALVCAADAERPTSVCAGPAVTTAATALGLAP